MECPICWDSLVSPSSPTVSLPCGHLFHETCLTPILCSRLSGRGGDPDCPTCRASIKLIPQRDLARVPNDLREYCLPAIRRVYLTPPDASGVDTQREIDLIYARLSETQEKLQNSIQKEKSAEQRLRAIMDLWKQEQGKNADLQRRLRAVEDRSRAVKRAPAPAPAPAPASAPAPAPIPALAPASAIAPPVAPGFVPPNYGAGLSLPTPPPPPIIPTDPWHALEQEMISSAVRSDGFLRMFPRPMPPQLPPPLLASHPGDFRLYPFGAPCPQVPYPQALAPVPHQPPALQPTNMPLPSMPPTPVQSVIAHAGPVDGSGPTYPTGTQPHAQIHYGPAVGGPAGYPVARTPQPMTPNLAIGQMRSQSRPVEPATSTDPRPRHLSGAAREREYARIRMQMEHARLQQAFVRQTSQQNMPGPSQRWGGTS